MKKHILHTAIRPSKGLALLLLLLLGTLGRMQAQLIITIEIAEIFEQTTSLLGGSSGSPGIQVYFDNRLMTTDDLKEGSPFATNANSSVNGVVLPLAYDTYFFVKTGDILEFEIAKDEMPTNISFGCDDNNDPEKACEYPANFGFENLAINTWRGTNDFSQSTGVFNLPEDKYYELVFFEETSDTICNQTAEGVTCYDYGGFYLDDYGYPCDPDECIDEEVFNNITEVWIRFRYKWNIPELNVVLSSNTSTPVEDNIINCEEEVKLSIQYIDDYILNKNVTYYWQISKDLVNWEEIPNTTSSGNVSITYANEITYTPSVDDGFGNSTRHYRARYHVQNEALSTYVYTNHEVYPAAPSVVPFTVDDISCHGEKGSLQIDENKIVGGSAPFTTALAYIDPTTGDLRVKDSGQDKFEYPNLTENDYILRVTNSDFKCTTPDYDFSITEPDELTYSITSTQDISCHGGDDGSIYIKATGGTGAVSFSKDNGSTFVSSNITGKPYEHEFTGLSAGTYKVTITDENSCTSTVTSITLDEPDELSATTDFADITCATFANGAINITADGGTSPYSFSKNGGTSFVSSNGDIGEEHSFSQLTKGDYALVVKDDKGCQWTDTETIAEPLPIAWTTVIDSVSCHGDADGSITITASEGNGGFSYQLESDGYSTQNEFSDLDGGSYTIQIKDSKGCTAEASNILVYEPNELSLSIDKQTQVQCYGQGDGSITLQTTGGNGDNTFYWRDASFTTTSTTSATKNNLLPQSYRVYVEDRKGCQSSFLTPTITQPSALTVSASTQDATCYKDNDGYIDLSSSKISGGTTPYSISFTQGSTTTEHSPKKFEDLAAATYYYTVEDDNGCTVDDEATVGQPDSLALDIDFENISCKNAENGSIQLGHTGGNDSFTYYQKATGAADYSSNSSGTFSDLLPSSYEVKVIDNKGCETIDNLVLTEPDSILIEEITVTDIECSNTALGSIALDVSGGNELIYSWDEYPDSSRSQLTGIRGGTYTFEVTDNKHCPSFGTKSAFVFESEPITVSTSQEDLTCFKSQDGSISLTVSDGGTAPYTYSLIGQSENQSTGDFDDLAATTFDWKVSDAEGCFQSGEITLTQPDTMVLALSSIDTVSCKDYTNGAFEVSATGGTGSYFYSLDGAAYQEEKNSYSLLSAGSYTVALKDERGCTATPLDVVLTEPDSLKIEEIVSTDILCHGEATGAITVSTTGGNSEHSFQWIGYPDHSDATFEQLPAGNYAFNVTDRKYCPSYGSKTIVLSQPSALTLTATSVDVSCHNAQNGEISLQAQGGVAPYQYRINQEGYGTAQAFASLDTGAYTWTVLDDNLCELGSTEDILITQPDSLRLAVSQFDSISCYGAKDGALDLSASGGTSPYAYAFNSYSYSEGATTYQDIDTGQYVIRLQDAQGCKDSIALDYVQADSLVIDSIAVIDLICAEEANGSMLAYVSGGNGGTTYHWTEFTESNQAGIDNIAGGTYSLYVSDRRACETPLMSAVVFEPAKMEVSTTPEDATCNGEINGAIVLNITSGGTAPFAYSIDNGQSFSDDPLFSSQAFGLYQWVVKDGNACQVSGEVEINEPTPLVFNLKESYPTLCFASSDGSVSVSASGGTRPYSFSVDKENYDTDSTLSNLSAGDYKVYIKDRYNCMDSIEASITEPTAITATFDNTHLICTGDTNGTIQVSLSGGTPFYSVLWNDGQTSTLAENLSAGTYQLSVTDANECAYSFETEITQPADSFKVSITSATNTYCDELSDGMLEASLTGGTAPYVYAWDDPNNTTDALQLSDLAHSRYYRITATDQLGCQKEDSAYIDFDVPFEVLDIPSDTLVLCDNESMTLDQTQALVSHYLWLHNGATFSTDPVATIDTTGEFSITIADALGCMDSRTFYVDTSENNVNALFIASNKVVYGDTLRLIDVSWPNPQSVVWDFGDGFVVEDDEVTPVVGFPDDIDSVEVKITATLGTCVDHYSKMIYFYPEDQLGQSTSKLGFKGIIEYNVQPNPTAGEFYLRLKLHEQAPASLKIFDVNGELVEQKDVSGQDIYREKFDLSHVSRGVYFLRMETQEDFQIVRFLVY